MIGIVMGSKSDWTVMKQAVSILNEMGIPYEAMVVSAHRTPHLLFEYAQNADKFDLIIAGAGGAAHLPGMIASLTRIPVLGVPIESLLKGIDSLLSN
jgi:5-(carboxyamino)imidazole ribonucleotide mutase